VLLKEYMQRRRVGEMAYSLVAAVAKVDGCRVGNASLVDVDVDVRNLVEVYPRRAEFEKFSHRVFSFFGQVAAIVPRRRADRQIMPSFAHRLFFVDLAAFVGSNPSAGFFDFGVRHNALCHWQR
jgi:hypothetical protein